MIETFRSVAIGFFSAAWGVWFTVVFPISRKGHFLEMWLLTVLGVIALSLSFHLRRMEIERDGD